MKSIGMFFIIAGHIFPLGYEFLYVFSVPLFFLISGYLGHRETNDKLFWKKTFSNLIIPCIIISLVLHIEQIAAQVRLGTFEWINIPTYVINCLMGNLALHTKASGIGICWFIYTLVLCKVIQQFVSKSKKANVVVLIVCLAVAVWYNINDMHLCNAYTNITLAYPLYAIGGGINC